MLHGGSIGLSWHLRFYKADQLDYPQIRNKAAKLKIYDVTAPQSWRRAQKDSLVLLITIFHLAYSGMRDVYL